MIYLICSRCDLLTVAVSTVPKLPNDHVFTLARILDGYNDNAIRVSIRVLPFFWRKGVLNDGRPHLKNRRTTGTQYSFIYIITLQQ